MDRWVRKIGGEILNGAGKKRKEEEKNNNRRCVEKKEKRNMCKGKWERENEK